jgi:hypothetical protein
MKKWRVPRQTPRGAIGWVTRNWGLAATGQERWWGENAGATAASAGEGRGDSSHCRVAELLHYFPLRLCHFVGHFFCECSGWFRGLSGPNWHVPPQHEASSIGVLQRRSSRQKQTTCTAHTVWQQEASAVRTCSRVPECAQSSGAWSFATDAGVPSTPFARLTLLGITQMNVPGLSLGCACHVPAQQLGASIAPSSWMTQPS